MVHCYRICVSVVRSSSVRVHIAVYVSALLTRVQCQHPEIILHNGRGTSRKQPCVVSRCVLGYKVQSRYNVQRAMLILYSRGCACACLILHTKFPEQCKRCGNRPSVKHIRIHDTNLPFARFCGEQIGGVHGVEQISLLAL